MAVQCGWKYNMPRADSRLSNALSSKTTTLPWQVFLIGVACCTACSFCFWLMWICLKLSQPSMSLSPVTKADSVVRNTVGWARWGCSTWWYFDDTSMILQWSWCAFDMRLMSLMSLMCLLLAIACSILLWYILVLRVTSVVLLWQSLRVRLRWGGEASLGAQGITAGVPWIATVFRKSWPFRRQKSSIPKFDAASGLHDIIIASHQVWASMHPSPWRMFLRV